MYLPDMFWRPYVAVIPPGALTGAGGQSVVQASIQSEEGFMKAHTDIFRIKAVDFYHLYALLRVLFLAVWKSLLNGINTMRLKQIRACADSDHTVTPDNRFCETYHTAQEHVVVYVYTCGGFVLIIPQTFNPNYGVTLIKSET